MRATTLLFLALAAGVMPAAAQQSIDRTVPSSSGGEVEIVNTAGSVRVSGWDRPEIHISGTLGQGTQDLEVSGDREHTEIRVVIPRNSRNVRGSDLTVRVPAGKTVRVRTTSADIEVREITGAVHSHSTSGDVDVTGRPASVVAGSTSGDVTVAVTSTTRVQATSTSGDVSVSGTVRESVNVEAVSGDVEVRAATPEVRAKAVSGDLRLRGVSGRVSASTVSGDAEISDSRVQYGSFETVSGQLRFQGTLQRGAAITVQSHSGDVELALPRNLAAEIEARTFSGDIQNDFGGEVRRTGQYTPGRELRFTAGGGGSLITIKTFSGTVRLVRR